MNEAIDFSTLKWVKQELDETLKQARQALEAYVENTDDEAQLRFCSAHLHQVYGTLQMVEIYGAALLAEEMEQVAIDLLEGRVARRQEAFELLMQAILQLPDYLERLLGGARDVPLALLPLLNDLRATRGQKLLSENALFAPDLERQMPGFSASGPDASDPREQARGLRHQFQLGLLAWIRNREDVSGAGKMRAAIAALEDGATREPAARLWWIAGALLEALATKSLDASVSANLLLGQVDRQIKMLIDEGEESLAAAVPADLLKNLLFYVAQAGNGGPVIAAVKGAYGLDTLLPSADEVEAARESISGRNEELLATVSVAIRDDLARVKDGLDLYVRTGQGNVEDLGALTQMLQQVGDTLGVLGLGAARKTVQGLAASLQDMADGRRELSDGALMEFAGALLAVESALNGMTHGGRPLEADDLDADSLPDSEYREVLKVVAQEAIADVARAKEAIIAFTEAPDDFSHLEPVPQLFHQIKGGLLLLGEERAAAVVDSIYRYVSDELLERGNRPADAGLNALADAISSIEYYLEDLKDNRIFGTSALDVAARSVGELGYEVSGPVKPDAAAGETVVLETVAFGADRTEPTDGEDAAPVSLSEAAGDDVEEIEIEAPPPPELAPAVSSVGVQNQGLAPLSEDVDDEILQIFIEEAEEELANINDQLPRWIADLGDADALSTMRRSFHTLKGSGRLVGAALIGEFAWAYENMLNRVIDGTIVAGEEMFALLNQSRAALAELIEQIKGGPAPALDFQALMDGAAALSRGDVPAQPIDRAGPVVVGVPRPDGEEQSAAVAIDAVMDPVLYEIFNTETRGHIVVIQGFVDWCRAQGQECRVTEDLVRALHTLHGSARMAGAVAIAEVGSELERYVKALMAEQLPVPEDGLHILEQGAELVGNMLGMLLDNSSDPNEYREFLDRLRALPRTEEEIMDLAATNETLSVEQLADNVESVEEEIELAAPPGAGEPEVLDEAAGDSDVRWDSDDTVPAGEMHGESALAKPEVDEVPAVDGFEVSELELPEAIGSGDAEGAEQELTLEAAEELEDLGTREDGSVAEASGYQEADAELVEIFLEEGDEILEASDSVYHEWAKDPANPALMAELQRALHTLKGGARMAGIAPIGDLSHAVESLLTAVGDGRVVPGATLFDLLQQSQDRLVHMLESVRTRSEIAPAAELITALDALHDGVTAPSVPEVMEEQVLDDAPDVGFAMPELPIEAEPEVVEIEAELAPVAEERRTAMRGSQELVRVRADLLDNLVNYAGEISIYRARLEQQTGAFRFNLTELDQTIARLRDQLRKLEIETEAQILFRYERESVEGQDDFDPLEMDRYSQLQQLSRSLMESVSDLASIEGLLDTITRESETLLLQQSRVNTELQEGLMRTRMVPFSGLAPRMRRVVRQTCKELGKQAELVLSGTQGEMDRTVIDRMIAPIEHMLRNAISHGLEMPHDRQVAGKPETGTIHVSLSREASDVVIRIADDGCGMDLDAIRRKAEERGLVLPGAELTDNDITQFVLETGFSTAEEITQISGRGVGMDVVNSEVKQLGGSLEIATERGRGTTFTIRLPFTLAINQALLVTSGDDTYAIPLSSIEGIVRITRDELDRHCAESNPLEYAGNIYPVHHLSSMLGSGGGAGTGRRVPLLLVRAGDHRAALHVDALLGSREIVVKSVGPQISTVRGISGATILGDGRVVLILDLGALVRLTGGAQSGAVEEIVPEEEAERPITVMVVDDSITVRKITARLLERNGMNVIAAKDGVDAVAKLQDHLPDVMLLDIEMPRMDGFELATHVRNEERLRSIPMIMITSRTGEKHRRRAEEIGVDRYLGKPYQETDLLETIGDLLENGRGDG